MYEPYDQYKDPMSIWRYKTDAYSQYQQDVLKSLNQQNWLSDLGLFGKNFAKGLLDDPIGGIANIWNTYNTWRNNQADLKLKQDQFNMQKDAYQNNERRTEQAFQEHRANWYGNSL